MNFLKGFIYDNIELYKKLGLMAYLGVWLKLIGYLIIVPFINILLIWKLNWIVGILFLPVTYVCYVIPVEGREGIMKLSLKIVNFKNKIFNWWKK